MNPSTIVGRVRNRFYQKPSKSEIFSLGLVLGMVGIFIYLSPKIPYAFFDFRIYLNISTSGYGYYYGYWLLPVFNLLEKLPILLSYVLWSSMNILGVFFASRVFGGKAPLALLSFQMLYSLIIGQISGLIVGGLALCWWGLVNKKWYLAGIGIALASTKYQMGLVGSLILLFSAGISWKDWLRSLLIPSMVWAASLVFYPGWPLDVYHLLLNNPPNDQGSLSLWRWVGPWALLFWLPPLVIKISPQRRLLALVAASSLALPYFQSNDLLWLLVMPIGWVGLLGNLGFFLGIFGWIMLQLLALLPLVVYTAALVPKVGKWIKLPAGDDFNPPNLPHPQVGLHQE